MSHFEKLEELFTPYQSLMPDVGNADTLFGEVVRACNRISYRYYNDGDLYYEGYGVETVGNAIKFLIECKKLPNTLHNDLKALFLTHPTDGDKYEAFLVDLFTQCVAYFTTHENVSFSGDMFDDEFEPNSEYDSDNELFYFEDEDDGWDEDEDDYEDWDEDEDDGWDEDEDDGWDEDEDEDWD